MNLDDSDRVAFQITVARLTVSSQLPEEDIRVTVGVSDESKITCAGELSEDGLTVSWNHPFLFNAPPSTAVYIAVSILPELAPGWDKQPLGDQIVTNVATLLESGNNWQCNVPGFSSLATLFISCEVSNTLIIPDGHDCLPALRSYDWRLYEFGRQFKNVSCLSTKVEVGLARLDLCPLGDANHTNVLDNLGSAFHALYSQGGSIPDLNKAIEIYQARLDLCPLGHPEHTSALGELALCLWKHYHIQRNEADLNRVIEMQERRLDLCPLNHPDHERALGNLAASLISRYYTHKQETDLNRAIEMEEKRLELCPPGHSFHAEALGNLAVSLHSRYDRMENLADLNRVIDLEEEKLILRPPGHRSHGLALQNLAFSLQDRFHATENHSDLHRAIQLYEQASNTYSPQYRRFAYVINALAGAFHILFQSPPPDQPPPSLDNIFETYGQLKRCGPAVSLDLLEATQNWVRDAETHNHVSVLEAYRVSLNALDHFTSLDSSLASRHETMQTKVADLANNGFSCAIRHCDSQTGVELLEQGRGILWSQLARFDIPTSALESQGDAGRALEKKFKKLSRDLREHAHGGGGMEPYWRAQEKWQSVVNQIRQLHGFSRFLLPPHFEDLQQAAECGPVIIVNASEYTCDALIVLHTQHPVHVPLPCSFVDVIQFCSQLSDLTRNPHAYGAHRELWVRRMLRDLWSSVVKPIASALQDDIQLLSGSRIWWCPTSRFTMLPFHAAGPHQKTEKNMFDIYVSSYAPSLSALLRARDRIRSQRAIRDASGKEKPISFVAVGQGQPSTDTKLGELPEVAHEIRKIRDDTCMPANSVDFHTLTGSSATVEGTVQAFRDHRWVHIACHGGQHAEKPFESWFAMGDGKLTLMRIIQERYMNSEFAFLSACHTAVGDASTPDEVLHLAAGMQFAGFNGVIGTLWRVDDAVAHQMVTQFYKAMFRYPDISFEHAAEALNTAVVETADEVSLEKRIVFVHIGI